MHPPVGSWQGASVSILETDGALYGVEIGATFFTGIELDDAPSLLGRSQESANERLARSADVPFRSVAINGTQPHATYFGIEGAVHGSEVVPRVFASVDPDWLLQRCVAPGPAGWRISSAECDLHDFGVAIIVLRWTPIQDSASTVPAMRELLAELTESSSSSLSDLPKLIADAMQSCLGSDPTRIDVTHGLDMSVASPLPQTGSVLWLWHVLLVSAHGPNRSELAARVAAVVCPNRVEIVDHRDHTFAAGVHASVVCSSAGFEHDARYLADAPRLADAWWTMYWRLDRVLLSLQLLLQLTQNQTSLRDLEHRATLLRSVAARVNGWRSRLDSILVASGDRDNDAFLALDRAWKLDRQRAAADRKISILDQSYAQAIEQIRAARSHRVDVMIYLFTAFSVVASVVAVAQYAQGAPDGRLAVRASVVLLSLITAVAALVLSLRTRSAVKRRPPK